MAQEPLRIDNQHEGVAISCDATIIVFHAPKAFPPGQPLALTLWPNHERALPLSARSIGSKLLPDQRFEVRARLINLSRPAREHLIVAFGTSP
jgi:hypothetical protein